MDQTTEIEQQEVLTKKLIHFFRGNLDAVRFCIDFVYICHLWDDLIDKDKERTVNEINDAFRAALVEIPGNVFYLANMHILRPIILNIILQWEDANVLETSSEHDVQMAWMLRAGLIQLFNVCAYIIGGPDWARQVGPDIRRLYDEKLEDFMKEMKCQVEQ